MMRLTVAGDSLSSLYEIMESGVAEKLNTSAELVKDQIKFNYGTHMGGAIIPLSEKTVEKKGGDSRPLIDTGSMMEAVDVVKNANDNDLAAIVGFNNSMMEKRAMYHEFGTIDKNGNVPARPVWLLTQTSPEVRNGIQAILDS